MVQSPRNALLHPPFFLIPGINPHSPVSTQTEQIDQLNTLLLQEIDANFAKFHQVVNSKILPEIKRFALAGQPTREAAAVSPSFLVKVQSLAQLTRF
jgi:DASH complex subunit ASK1